MDKPMPPPLLDGAFRNGSLTAIGVVLGFSLSFLTRWAGTPGEWLANDLLGASTIIAGIGFQIAALVQLFQPESLHLPVYRRAIRLFMIGLGLTCGGVLIAIALDVLRAGTILQRF